MEELLSEKRMRELAAAYGTATIPGKIPWKQDQVGSKTQSFYDGMKSVAAIVGMLQEKLDAAEVRIKEAEAAIKQTMKQYNPPSRGLNEERGEYPISFLYPGSSKAYQMLNNFLLNKQKDETIKRSEDKERKGSPDIPGPVSG